MEETCYQLSIGQVSPILFPTHRGGGAGLLLDGAVPVVICGLPDPTPAEMRACEYGRVDVAIDRQGTSAFWFVRLRAPAGKDFTLECPFHVGLEEIEDFPNLSSADLEPGEGRGLIVVIQDEASIVRMMRPLCLPRAVLEMTEAAVLDQLADKRVPGVQDRHRRNTERYYARVPDPERGFLAAPCKGLAGRARPFVKPKDRR